MGQRVLVVCVVAVAVFLVTACGSSTVEPAISFDDEGCTSNDPAKWSTGAVDITVANQTTGRVAVVMGTYNEGFGHQNLVAYGSDISTRPDFINALSIFEVAPNSSSNLPFDHGPGTYFITCLPSANTMTVLDDLIVDG